MNDTAVHNPEPEPAQESVARIFAKQAERAKPAIDRILGIEPEFLPHPDRDHPVHSLSVMWQIEETTAVTDAFRHYKLTGKGIAVCNCGLDTGWTDSDQITEELLAPHRKGTS